MNFSSILSVCRKSDSASLRRFCLARIVPRRLSTSGELGVVREMEASCRSASTIRLSRMSAATRSNRWTRSVSWAMTGATQIAVTNMRSLKTNTGGSYFLNFFLNYFPDQFCLRDLTLTFFDGHDAIDADAGHLIDIPARPPHLDQIDFRALLETEVQPLIALRNITVAT